MHACSTLRDYELPVYISPQILIKLPRQVDFWRLQTSPRGLERGRGASQEVGPGNGGEDMKSHSAHHDLFKRIPFKRELLSSQQLPKGPLNAPCKGGRGHNTI